MFKVWIKEGGNRDWEYYSKAEFETAEAAEPQAMQALEDGGTRVAITEDGRYPTDADEVRN